MSVLIYVLGITRYSVFSTVHAQKYFIPAILQRVSRLNKVTMLHVANECFPYFLPDSLQPIAASNFLYDFFD